MPFTKEFVMLEDRPAMRTGLGMANRNNDRSVIRTVLSEGSKCSCYASFSGKGLGNDPPGWPPDPRSPRLRLLCRVREEAEDQGEEPLLRHPRLAYHCTSVPHVGEVVQDAADVEAGAFIVTAQGPSAGRVLAIGIRYPQQNSKLSASYTLCDSTYYAGTTL